MKLFYLLFGLWTVEALRQGDAQVIITKLEEVLKASKEQMAADTEAQNEANCSCDTLTSDYKKTIKEKTDEIEMLGADIEKKQGENSSDSMEVAKKKQKLAQMTEFAKNAKEKMELAKTTHEAEEAKLTETIASLENAVTTLEGLSGGSFLTKTAVVQRALSLVEKNFGRGPYGKYSSQSTEILGILRNMKDTFSETSKQAKADFESMKEQYEITRDSDKQVMDNIDDFIADGQAELASRSSEVSVLLSSLDAAKTAKANAEESLTLENDECAQEQAAYDEKHKNQLGEQEALSKALAILSSDEAFKSFGKSKALLFLQNNMKISGSHEYIAVLEKMVKDALTNIEEESKTDQAEFAKCDKDQTALANAKTAAEGKKTASTTGKEQEESNLSTSKDNIESTETDISNKRDEMKEADKARSEAKQTYISDLANDRKSLDTVKAAIIALQAYFDGQEKSGAQNEGGNKVIEMLQTVETNLTTQIKDLENEETAAVASYENTREEDMKNLTQLGEDLASFKVNKGDAQAAIAGHEQIIRNQTEAIDSATQEEAAIEPDCTFIQTNLEKRKEQRKQEKSELENLRDNVLPTLNENVV